MKNTIMFTLAMLAPFAAQAATPAAQDYQITFTTGYGFNNPFAGSTFLGGGTPNPDTGFVQVTNTGLATFTGKVATVAVTPSRNDSFTSAKITLAPGASVSIAIGPESSNMGGYNGGKGVRVVATGKFSLSGKTEVHTLARYDSGILRAKAVVSPCDGIKTKGFVLQGGAASGCDNGDNFETTQAQGTAVVGGNFLPTTK